MTQRVHADDTRVCLTLACCCRSLTQRIHEHLYIATSALQVFCSFSQSGRQAVPIYIAAGGDMRRREDGRSQSLLYGRARFAHPGETRFLKRLPTPLQGVSQLFLALPKVFNPNVPYLSGRFMLCPNFQDAELAHNYFKTLPKLLHTLKNRARTLHTLLAIDKWASLA